MAGTHRWLICQSCWLISPAPKSEGQGDLQGHGLHATSPRCHLSWCIIHKAGRGSTASWDIKIGTVSQRHWNVRVFFLKNEQAQTLFLRFIFILWPHTCARVFPPSLFNTVILTWGSDCHLACCVLAYCLYPPLPPQKNANSFRRGISCRRCSIPTHGLLPGSQKMELKLIKLQLMDFTYHRLVTSACSL